MPMDPTAPDLPLPGATPVQAVTRFWARYAVFTGRASRSEYWWAALANLVALLVLGVVFAVPLGVGAALLDEGVAGGAVLTSLGAVVGLITVLFSLAIVVPSIAASVRRLHDADYSGLIYLVSFVPYVGGFIVLVLNVLPSNPNGRRFDRDAARSPLPAPIAEPAAPIGVARPVTAPTAFREQVPEPPRSALRSVWAAEGDVEDVRPRLSAQPSWRRQRYLRVVRSDGIGILATDGLADAEGSAALGAGAELHLASTALATVAPDFIGERWELAVVAGVARRVGASGMHLPAELAQHGALSMALPVSSAPRGWAADDGTVGVLIGVPLAGVPESVATASGEVRLVGVAALRPEELRSILDGGRAARATIAERLAALPPLALADPERTAVLSV